MHLTVFFNGFPPFDLGGPITSFDLMYSWKFCNMDMDNCFKSCNIQQRERGLSREDAAALGTTKKKSLDFSLFIQLIRTSYTLQYRKVSKGELPIVFKLILHCNLLS